MFRQYLTAFLVLKRLKMALQGFIGGVLVLVVGVAGAT